MYLLFSVYYFFCHQRLNLRAQRFGTSVNRGGSTFDDEKLAARARRFGLPLGNGTPTAGINANQSADLEKLKKRAERFGETTSKTLEHVSSWYKSFLIFFYFIHNGGEYATLSHANWTGAIICVSL